MNTLITGVGGMIGFAVASKLAKMGHSVIGLDIILPTSLKNHGVELIQADLINASFLDNIFSTRKIDNIIHSGGISGPMLHADNPRKVFDINFYGTLNITEIARKYSINRLIFLSSFVTYGEQSNISEVTEDSPQKATNAYAASKIAAEAMIRSYREEHDLNAVSLRLGAVYGPGRKTDCIIRSLLRNAINQKPTKLPFGKNWSRPYVFLDDIVNAICLALAVPSTNFRQYAYNIAGDIWPSLSEVAKIIENITNFHEITLENGRTPHDYLIGPLSLQAANRDLNYTPSSSLVNGIANYHEWLKTNDF